MCRYLATTLSDDHDNTTTTYDVTCTGVDTSDQVKYKYKDADFILRNIDAINNNKVSSSTAKNNRVQTRLVHGVNAVQPTTTSNDNNNNQHSEASSALQHYDHVLFHHPHLGTEDARRHKRFLLHFFHAANKRWMKPNGGLLYLTLVRGQCERWDCIMGAGRHGLVLLRRGKFCPPPPPLVVNESDNSDNNSSSSKKDDRRVKTYYQLRRHQSGKSFANRRIMQVETTTTTSCDNVDDDGESETLVFGRCCDYPSTFSLEDSNIGMLPWENAILNDAASAELSVSSKCNIADSSKPVDSSIAAHPCNYCTKSFHEQRSLKNHIICSHPHCDEAIAWANSKKDKKGKKRKLKRTTSSSDRSTSSDHLNENQQQLTQQQDIMATGEQQIVCKICESQKTVGEEDQPMRIFPHLQALLDHQRAKHSGVHKDIKPDWYDGGEENISEEQPNEETASIIGSCPICDLAFFTEGERISHEQDFIPAATSSSTDGSDETGKTTQASIKCTYCSKTFREVRAKLQHENFCSSAVVATNSTK